MGNNPKLEKTNMKKDKPRQKKKKSNENSTSPKKKTDQKKNRLFYIPLILGILIFSYPFVSNAYYKMKQKQANDAYYQKTEKKEQESQKKTKQEYETYNQHLREQNYQELDMPFLKAQRDNLVDSKKKELGEVLAVVEIPKILVELPVYYGTSDVQLQQGAGLLKNTSLPIGGAGTHSVITGHRGLHSAKLFTDLPKLKLKDQFYIHIENETHAYEVDQIKVVEPTQMEDLKLVSGQDYVTLLTCTPYMVNTHRLLVRGHRVPYNKERRDSDLKTAKRNYFKEISLFVLGALIIVLFLVRRKIRKKPHKKKYKRK